DHVVVTRHGPERRVLVTVQRGHRAEAPEGGEGIAGMEGGIGESRCEGGAHRFLRGRTARGPRRAVTPERKASTRIAGFGRGARAVAWVTRKPNTLLRKRIAA